MFLKTYSSASIGGLKYPVVFVWRISNEKTELVHLKIGFRNHTLLGIEAPNVRMKNTSGHDLIGYDGREIEDAGIKRAVLVARNTYYLGKGQTIWRDHLITLKTKPMPKKLRQNILDMGKQMFGVQPEGMAFSSTYPVVQVLSERYIQKTNIKNQVFVSIDGEPAKEFRVEKLGVPPFLPNDSIQKGWL